MSDETFDFLHDLHKLKDDRKDQDLQNVVTDVSASNEKIKTLMEKYIFSGADREINISGALRDAAVAYYKKALLNPAEEINIEHLFGPAAGEARQLLLSQKLVRQFENHMFHNMSMEKIRQMRVIFVMCSCLSVAILVLTIQFNASRWIRVLTLMTNLLAGIGVTAGFGRVCPVCAAGGIRFDSEDSDPKAFKEVRDALFRQYVQIRVNQRMRLCVLTVILVTIVVVAIPEQITPTH